MDVTALESTWSVIIQTITTTTTTTPIGFRPLPYICLAGSSLALGTAWVSDKVQAEAISMHLSFLLVSNGKIL